jgi:hypothetical protein
MVRMINECNDFDKIVEQRRFVSGTDGRVYALIEKGFLFKWHTRSWINRNNQGKIIFVDSAAKMFRRPFPIGPFTSIKRAFGQYVANYGEFRWNDEDQTLNGSTLIIKRVNICPYEDKNSYCIQRLLEFIKIIFADLIILTVGIIYLPQLIFSMLPYHLYELFGSHHLEEWQQYLGAGAGVWILLQLVILFIGWINRALGRLMESYFP